MLTTHRARATSARRGERGFMFILFAVFSVVIVGLVGLAVDSAHIQSAGMQLQNAADAAALAAARTVQVESSLNPLYTVTRKNAVDCAALNIAAEEAVILNANAANLSTGDIVVGHWSPSKHTFTPTIVSPNAVKVTTRLSQDSVAGPLDLTFGGMFGVLSSDVERSAIAAATVSPSVFLHVLDPTAKAALQMKGNAQLNVPAGAVLVNSSSSCAIDFNGNPVLAAAKTSVHGYTCVPGGGIQGELEENAEAQPDPLAHILPTVSDWNDLRTAMAQPLGPTGAILTSGIYVPGYYPAGLSINNSMVVTLLPGTYMFGGDVSLGGQTLVAGEGVTLLMDQDATFLALGGASLVLSPPTSGLFDGLTLMFHRQTTNDTACSIGGTGAISFDGTLYCPAGGVDLGGTGEVQKFGQIICNTLFCSGTPTITGDEIVPAKGAGPVCLVQ
jgi:Flp pilus assembly protein TadG